MNLSVIGRSRFTQSFGWIIGEILIMRDYHEAANYRPSLFVFQSHLSNLSKMKTNLLQAPPLPVPASETVLPQHLYNVLLLACVTMYWNGACFTNISLHIFHFFLPDLAGLIKNLSIQRLFFYSAYQGRSIIALNSY